MIESVYEKPLKLIQNKIVRYPGGRELDRFRGVENPQDDGRPEAWVGSTTTVVNAPDLPDKKTGMAQVQLNAEESVYLDEVIQKYPIEMLGGKHVARNGNNTAILPKLLDAQHQLVLQAHPTRQYAKERCDSPYGKTESWYVIGVRNDSVEPPYVLLGFKEGVTREIFENFYLAEDVSGMEECCHKVQVAVGDMYFIEAGLPHVVGPGCFIVELQEASDITVGIRRKKFEDPEMDKAFIDRAMGCFIYNGKNAVENLKKYKIEPQILSKDDKYVESLLIGSEQTSYFSMTKVEVMKEFALRDTGTFSIVIILEGEGKLVFKTGEMNVKKSDELFLPASLKNALWQTNTGLTMVHCYPSDVL